MFLTLIFLTSLSDRNPTWPLKPRSSTTQSMVSDVSVIEILRGHSNPPRTNWPVLVSVSVIEILRGHSNTQDGIIHFHGGVSVIEILRGHSNELIDMPIFKKHCLSDRNPTWPLKLSNLKQTKMKKSLSDRNPTWPLKQGEKVIALTDEGLSDRNPTWPLKHKDINFSLYLLGFLNCFPVAITPNYALSQKNMVFLCISQ